MKYKSKAKWPAIVSAWHGSSISEDIHDTRQQSEAVCARLMRYGLGGDGRIFPILVWVEESPTLGSFERGLPAVN